MNKVKIGIIGLDTSHVVVFTKLLNQPDADYYLPGGEVVVAYPGGSKDMELSHSRVEKFTKQIRDDFGIKIVDSPKEVAENCDAILLESVDGRIHLEQFSEIAPFGKPVFIDKPLAANSSDANKIAQIAKQYNTPLMSSSALRYAENVTSALKELQSKDIIGVDAFGPLALEEHHGLFWYGIHTVEMLFRILGRGCEKVTVIKNEDHDVIVGEWEDGRMGIIRGNRLGNVKFGATIHHKKGPHFVTVEGKPFYASMLEKILPFFQTGIPDIQIEETLEIVRFLEAANESRKSGKTVTL